MTFIKQAVILTGGLGTRMRPLTNTTPKPMIPIHGKPFLAYLVDLLRNNGIKEIVFLVGYLHEQIEQYFGNGEKFGIKIIYSYDPVETDTGSRVRNASQLFDKHFLLLYGDNYWPLNLPKLTKFYEEKKKKASTVVFSNFDRSTKNNMLVDENGTVKIYDRKRVKKNLNGVDIGFFILNKEVLSLLPNHNCSFEEMILQKLVKDGQLAGFLTHHKYYSLTNPERLKGIEKYFKKKKVVFLDRDGVINERPPKADYVKSWEEFVFLPKAKEALKILQKKGYEIYLVTSQAGIARGIMTREQADLINNRLIKELAALGVVVKGVYLCPHGWDEGCYCRKPNPGLFFQAAAEHHLDLYNSYCIGDDPRDILAGKSAGCKTIFISEDKNEVLEKPDRIVKDLYTAVIFLKI